VTVTSVGTVKVDYPATTTVTTTITNNTTNVSNTTTVTKTVTGQPAPPAKQDLPTDYNRENTQKAILDVLQGTGMPSAALKSADPTIAQIDGQNKTNSAAVDNITAGSVGIVNWFPSIPTAACVNPQVPNPIGGGMVDVAICDKVDIFSVFINGVIAVFCVFGCIREVSAAIKA
jgi:hypothetical protein